MNKLLRRQRGPTLVALVHQVLCDEPRKRWHNRLLAVAERRYLASVDGFIHNSETTQRTVAALISQRAWRPGPLELLFLGNVIPRKGLLPLLKALAGVDRSRWRLSVVGGLDFDPGHTVKVRRLVRQLGLTDSVRLLGPRQGDELVALLGRSHLFCMPYAYEGFGIATLEAMAFGLPAIGSRAGAAGETISHGTNGFLLAPGDLAGLAALPAKLHLDREELRRLALAACATYASRPGWQEGAAAIDGFLRQMKQHL